jgi:glutaredoxin
MKKTILILLFFTTILLSANHAYSAANVTLGSSAVPATSINQGSTSNLVYVVTMNVANESVTVNNIQFTLSGNHDANDLTNVYVYFNATSPVISGASYLGNSVANFAAPHAYSININKAMAAGSSGYFIISVNVSTTATDNKTIRITGATTPVTFGYTTAPNVTINETNNGGVQTIQAADINLTSSAVTAASINQGSTSNLVYVVSMNVATMPVTVNNIQFTLSGNHDANDLTNVYVYFNATSPVISGASYLGNSVANFAAPHAYSININKAMAAGSSGYFIISVNVSTTATDNKTIRITGATTPVTFGYTTAPNVTINETNNGGVQTIQAADINLTSSAVTAASINQGSTSNLVYVVSMNVATMPVTVNNIQFTLSGNHDANDLTNVYVYFNATSPVISGASYLGNSVANFAAPHAYSININKAMAAGSSGYFIISVNVSTTATDNKTIRITGATTPVTFGYTTVPNVTINETNNGGVQTIQAADINLTSSAVTAASINQGSTSNLVYVVSMNVATMPVTVNNIQFTLSGNHDANDLTNVYVYFNATSPVISGASYLGNSVANFAAPHAYSININKAMAAGSSGYFIISVNVSTTATDNKTIRITGATTPVTFGYTTVPNVTINETNNGGVQTIQAADVTLGTSAVAAGNIVKGSTSNIVYVTTMNVATMPVTVNNIQFTLSGTQDADDLTNVYVYFNATSPVISGASYLGNSLANFAAPHAYSININKAMAAGSSGYFIISVNVSASATTGKTVRVLGATTPVAFGYTTDPNETGSQTNGGLKTITASLGIAQTNTSENIQSQSFTNNISLGKVYPNPAKDIVYYSVTGNKNEKLNVKLTDLNGNTVIVKQASVNKGNNLLSMNVVNITNGVYELSITNEKMENIHTRIFISH